MQIASYLCMGSFVLASLVVSLRLFRLALRDPSTPEITLGLALLLAGTVAPVFSTTAGLMRAGDPAASATLWGLGLLTLNIGATALYAFTWQVFYPTGTWGAFVVAGAFVAMFLGLAGQHLSSGFAVFGMHDPWAYLSFAGRAAAFGWASWASLAQYRGGRRRARLGLVDALTVNRFLLWGIGAGAAFAIFALNLLRHLDGHFDPMSILSLVVVPVLGMISGAAVALAFFPPAAYRRRFAAEAEAK